jgi:ribonuclease R
MSKKKRTAYRKQKEEIYAFFKQNSGSSFLLNDIYALFSIEKNEDEKIFVRLMVEELEEEGKLAQTSKGKYTSATTNITQDPEGRVDHVNARFAFIRYDEKLKDIWVNTEDLGSAIDGDLVRVRITKLAKSAEKNPEGKVIEIIERGKKQLVGKLKSFGNYALVKPESKKIFDSVFIAKQHIHEAETNDLVIVNLLSYPTQLQQATGEVAEILGKSGENDAEMHAIMAEFGLPIRFPEEVEKEAEAISEQISDTEIEKRRDVRNTLTFTIDPADAKDFDDALSYKILENGNIEVGIHIADVSHYVRPDTQLEAEAFRRATSVYLVDRTIPMLPEKLSNGLCSLRPNEDKLVFSAIFELSPQATIISEWFGRCIIHSDRRFSYEQAQELLEAETTSEEDAVYFSSLQELNRLAKILKKERFLNGAINFETAEVKFQLDENGKPLGVYTKVRKDAHKLIEEFMLLANKRVATFVHDLYLKENKDLTPTMVYRIHEPPNPERVETFSKFAGRLGFSVQTYNQNVLSKSLNGLMDSIAGTPMQNVLEQLAVRTMSKARYSTADIGHFGLAFEHYSHFTSPIRRYPDVMAHRLLQNYLDGKPSPSKTEYDEKCKHSSDQERLAAEAERASIKYKQVEFMSLQDHRITYDGVITGVTDFGIFVEINGTGSEGLVRMNDLSDDYYEYDSENFRLVGQRKGRIINFGDIAQVKVKATNLQDRSIDLLLVSIRNEKIEQAAFSEKKGRNGGNKHGKSGRRR